MPVTLDQRRYLLRTAREAVVARVTRQDPETSARTVPAHASGAFVTLRIGVTLRGCVGEVEDTTSLVDTIRHVAAAAATEDPRFPPVRANELPELTIEISILGALESCSGPDDVEVGRHGLVAEDGARRGLLLPQVAVEWGWDCHLFVANTCKKAGLRPDAWQRGAVLLRFEAEVFSEDDARRPGSRGP